MEWHGWRLSTGGPALHIGQLPGRKSIALYVVDGSVLDTLAYFRSEADAEKALQVLDSIVEARQI